jgi:hypothetical protein
MWVPALMLGSVPEWGSLLMSQQVVYGRACVGVQCIVRTPNVWEVALRWHYPSEKNHQQTGCTGSLPVSRVKGTDPSGQF